MTARTARISCRTVERVAFAASNRAGDGAAVLVHDNGAARLHGGLGRETVNAHADIRRIEARGIAGCLAHIQNAVDREAFLDLLDFFQTVHRHALRVILAHTGGNGSGTGLFGTVRREHDALASRAGHGTEGGSGIVADRIGEIDAAGILVVDGYIHGNAVPYWVGNSDAVFLHIGRIAHADVDPVDHGGDTVGLFGEFFNERGVDRLSVRLGNGCGNGGGRAGFGVRGNLEQHRRVEPSDFTEATR